MQEWDLRPLLDHLKPRLTPEAHELLEALSTAINDRAAIKHLETLPACKAILWCQLEVDYAARMAVATSSSHEQTTQKSSWDIMRDVG